MNSTFITDWRTPLIVSFLVCSIIFYQGHSTGRVYPWMLGALFVGMALLALLAISGGSLEGIVTGGLLLVIAFRFHTNFITTPVGASPQNQPNRMDAIVETGSLITGSPFYDDAPFHFILVASYSAVSGLPGHDSILLYSLLISVVLCLVTLGLLRSIGVSDPRALGTAVLLALVTTEGLRRSYWVIPQVTATIVFWFSILVVANYVRQPTKQLYVVLVILTVALAFTHKLPLVFFSIIFVALLVLVWTDVIVWTANDWYSPVHQISSLLVFITVLSVAQVLYTGLVGTITRRLERMLVALYAGDPTAVRGDVDPGGAVEALPGIIAYFYEYPAEYALFVERGHGIWLLLAGGAAWAFLFFIGRNGRHRTQILVLLATSAIGVAMMAIGVIAIRGMNPTRPLFMIEPILVVMIVGSLWKAREVAIPPFRRLTVSFPIRRTLLVSLIIVLLATQIFAASAAPDYANTPRYYADVPEAQTEATICEYTQGDVHVDEHYSRFVDINKESCGDFTSFGIDSNNDLFDRNINVNDHETVAFREDVDVYLGDHDRWRLTWHPDDELSPEYDVVYDNDAVTVYHARA